MAFIDEALTDLIILLSSAFVKINKEEIKINITVNTIILNCEPKKL